MTTITDDFMKQMLVTTKTYTAVILKAGPNLESAEAQSTIWEHARRNFSLRADGLLSIVCPVNDNTEVKGIGVFDANEEKTKEIMDDDPAVKAGILIYEIHPCRSFPGDTLPR